MADDWASYFCRVNGSPSSIFLNLALASEAPILSKPWLLWIWIYFRTPRPDGLSSGEEATILFKIEDALIANVAERCKSLHAGRITTEGRREFYFYAETSVGFSECVSTALRDFPEYKFTLGDQRDSSWNQYLHVLYPSPNDLERIKNRRVLDLLDKEGDVSSVSREVLHWIYFPSARNRASFKAAAEATGYGIDSEYQAEDAEMNFVITLSRNQPATPDAIDESVLELCRLAEEHGGDYDGWETQVITQ